MFVQEGVRLGADWGVWGSAKELGFDFRRNEPDRRSDKTESIGVKG